MSQTLRRRMSGRMHVWAAVVAVSLTAVPAAPSAARSGDARTPPRPTAPHVDGITLTGDAISLRQFRGRVVFLNFWSPY